MTLAWLDPRDPDAGLDHERLWPPVLAGLLLLFGLYARAVAALPGLAACPLRALAGIPCPTCGGTRSLLALARLAPLEALGLNPLVALAALGAGAWCAYAVAALALGTRRLRLVALSRSDRAIAAAAIAANWIYLWLAGV